MPCGAKIPVQCNVEFHTLTFPPFQDHRFLCPTPQILRCAYYRLELCSAAQPRRILAPSIVQSTDHSPPPDGIFTKK